MSAALISAYNEALGMVAKDAISDLDEGSIEARECNRFGPSLLKEMGEWTDWHFMVARQTLALATNDRASEWNYAYTVPSDMGDPLHIRDSSAEDAATLPAWGYGAMPVQNALPYRFLIEGGKVYTNVQYAALVYSRRTLQASDLPPLARRAFVLELAARIAVPLTKDAKMAQTIKGDAELARVRAIADEENKRQNVEMRYVSEAELARAGVGV